MQNAYIVTGTLTNSQTVMLDEALPLSKAKVRLSLSHYWKNPGAHIKRSCQKSEPGNTREAISLPSKKKLTDI